MAQTSDERVDLFRTVYLPRLIERYRPTRVLLFGSRARGTALARTSDLDLIVVSEDFEGVPFLQRLSQVLWTLRTPFPVEVLCYTQEEYDRKKVEIGIVQVASREGLDLLRGEMVSDRH